jgi:hypothetical protein
MKDLETIIEHAQKITLGQVDNGTLATAVNCADTLQIVRHGIVESYVIPKHLIGDLLLKMAVIECDNKRLLGERVAESIELPTNRYFHDFRFDAEAIKKASEEIRKAAAKIRLEGKFSRPPANANERAIEDIEAESVTKPRCRHCLDPNCQLDDHCLFDRYWLTQPINVKRQPVVIKP